MYCAVPMIEPVSVMSDAPARAIPKSATCTRAFLVDQDVVRLDVAVHDPALVGERAARRIWSVMSIRGVGRRAALLADDDP